VYIHSFLPETALVVQQIHRQPADAPEWQDHGYLDAEGLAGKLVHVQEQVRKAERD
jgi:hypothetical protein